MNLAVLSEAMSARGNVRSERISSLEASSERIKISLVQKFHDL